MAGPVGAALGFANQGLHPRGPWTLVAASRAGTARLRGRPCPRLRPLSSFLPPCLGCPCPPRPPASRAGWQRVRCGRGGGGSGHDVGPQIPPGAIRQTEGALTIEGSGLGFGSEEGL